MKPFTQITPTRAGMYWYLDEPDSSPRIIRVFRDSVGYWMVQYDDLQATPSSDFDENEERGITFDFVANYRGWFSGPLRMPARPKMPEEVAP